MNTRFKTLKQDLSKMIPYQLDKKTIIHLKLQPGETKEDAIRRHQEKVEISRLGGMKRGVAIK
jgi:hypothetical protein